MNEVKSRQRKQSKAKEYYILAKNETGGIIYNGWYKLQEIIDFPECPVKIPNSVYERFKKVGDNLIYKTAWAAIIAPLARETKNKYAEKDVEFHHGPEFYESIRISKLWPVGSLAHTVY